MPIYEYRCAACEHTFSQLQKISDAPISICPACHAERAEKVMSAPAFKLKGTGWYATDFKDQKTDKSVDNKTSEAKAPEKTQTKKDDNT